MPDVIRIARPGPDRARVLCPARSRRPDGERITVFAREVADPDGRDRPFLVFLQGGPGFEAPRPAGAARRPGWIDRALQRLPRAAARPARHRALDARSARCRADARGAGGVPDALPRRRDRPRRRADPRASSGVERWSVLGQSFGGFCVAHVPLPGSRGPARGVHHRRAAADRPPGRRSLPRDVRARARPQPALLRALSGRSRRGCASSAAGSTPRTSGSRAATASPAAASARSATCWAWATAPSTCTTCSSCRPTRPPSSTTSSGRAEFARNPLYAALHEACYADGCATRWSAERLLPGAYDEQPELFTGEHVFPWMFEDFSALAPLREAAEILAEHEWPRLYDADRLRANEVPVGGADLRRGHVRRARLRRGDGRARPRP